MRCIHVACQVAGSCSQSPRTSPGAVTTDFRICCAMTSRIDVKAEIALLQTPAGPPRHYKTACTLEVGE